MSNTKKFIIIGVLLLGGLILAGVGEEKDSFLMVFGGLLCWGAAFWGIAKHQTKRTISK